MNTFAEIMLYGFIPFMVLLCVLMYIGVLDKVVIFIHNLFNKHQKL